MRRWIAILLLVGCQAREDGPAPAKPEPPFTCTNEWRVVMPGVEHRMLNCSPERRRFDLHLVRIDPKTFPLGAVVARGAAGDLGRPFAINANFFDENDRPLGVVVSDGKQLNREHRVSWQSIFLVTQDGEPHIVRNADWSKWKDRARMAVQAGPQLIVDGQKNEVVRAEPTWRSGVCVVAPVSSRASEASRGIRNGGAIIFFATPQESRFDVWQTAELLGALDCRDAMLFDGGPSTQLFLRGAVEVKGDPRVPAYVVGGS